MTKNILFDNTNYQIVDLGDKRVILSTNASFEIGDGTILGAKFSDKEIVIYAENVILSKELKAKSIFVSSFTITLSKKLESNKEYDNNTVFLQSDEDLGLKNKELLRLFDYNNNRNISITADSLPGNFIKIEEKIEVGAGNLDLSGFMFLHPVQCTMLLQKAQMLYRESDPISNKDPLDQAIIYLKRLRDRTKVFKDLKDDSVLAKLYKDNEKNIGAINSIATFKDVYKTADSLIGQISTGSDYYGNSYNYVPLASFDFYQKILNKQITNFGSIEKTFLNFFNANKKAKEKQQDLKEAKTLLNSIISDADSQIQDLKPRIQDTEIEIAGLQSQFKEKQAALKVTIENFKDAVERSFYLDIKSLFSSLTTLAFLSESPAGWILAGGEIGYDIAEDAQSVENDHGVAINKDYLVQVLKSFEGNLSSESLGEQYKKLGDGTIEVDDPGANKLIAEEQKVEKFLGDFYSKFKSTVEDLENAFKGYVALVLARNNKIVYYNAMVTMIIKNHNIIQESKNKIVILNEQNLKDYQPDLPAFTSLMTSLYSDAQSQVMSNLYLTERAFQFWSLNDDKPVANLLNGKKLVGINKSVLESAQSAILDSYGKAVENYRSDAQVFPTNDNVEGVIWNLDESNINTLKKVAFGNVHSVFFSIPVATSSSVITDNHFASYANVRLRKARVWLEGVTTSNDKIVLTITHNGNETICNQKNEQFDFKHNSKKVRFEYNLKTKELIEDADIGYIDKKENYALVGPFTWWTITIRPQDNMNLDLSKLTKVSIDFHGTNYTF